MTDLFGSIRPWSYLTAFIAVALVLLVSYAYYRHNRLNTLIAELKSGQPVAAQAAALSLGEMGSDTVVYLLPLIKDMDSQSRAYAAEAFRNIDSAVPSLIASLDDEEVDVRVAAAEVLGKIGPVAKDAVPALIKTMAEWNPSVREAAMLALGEIKDVQAIEPLFSVIYANQSSYKTAQIALGKIGKAGIPFLVEKLKDDDDKNRRCAAAALGEIGHEAKNSEAVQLLVAMLSNQPEEVSTETMLALGKIGDERAVGPLMRLLNREATPPSVIEALGGIGPAAKEAEPFLFDMVWMENLHRVAVQALKKISPELMNRITYEDQRFVYLEDAASVESFEVTREFSFPESPVPFTFSWSLANRKARVVFCSVVLIEKGVDVFDGNRGLKPVAPIKAGHATQATRNLSYSEYSASAFKWGVEVTACLEEDASCNSKTGSCVGRRLPTVEQDYPPQ